MTLEEKIIEARTAAILANQHVCNCDFSDYAGVLQHEQAMDKLFAAMDHAERVVLATYKESDSVTPVEPIVAPEALQSLVEEDEEEIDEMDYQELRDVASELKIRGRSSMNKAELLAAIELAIAE